MSGGSTRSGLTAIWASALLSALALAAPAHAAFPGKNGKIAFSRYDALQERSEIATMNADGSDQVSLEVEGSSNGSKIAFISDRDAAPWEIYVMNADGTGVTRVTHDEYGDYDPTWSPDGTKIAFSTYGFYPNPPAYQIYTMNPDGTDLTSLTGWVSERNYAPDWQSIPDPQRSDYNSAAQFCKAERDFLGTDGFRAKYGADHEGAGAFGHCVSENR